MLPVKVLLGAVSVGTTVVSMAIVPVLVIGFGAPVRPVPAVMLVTVPGLVAGVVKPRVTVLPLTSVAVRTWLVAERPVIGELQGQGARGGLRGESDGAAGVAGERERAESAGAGCPFREPEGRRGAKGRIVAGGAGEDGPGRRGGE